MKQLLSDLMEFGKAFLTKLFAYMTGGAFMAGAWFYSAILQKGDVPHEIAIAGLISFVLSSAFICWREQRIKAQSVMALLDVRNRRKQIQDALAPLITECKNLQIECDIGKPLTPEFKSRVEAWRHKTFEYLKNNVALLAAERFKTPLNFPISSGAPGRFEAGALLAALGTQHNELETTANKLEVYLHT